MRSRLLVIGAVALILAAGGAAASSGDRLEFGETKYDFGFIGIDYTGYYNFMLYNPGTETIIIKSAGASCDCSRVSVEDTLIGPGDTAYVRLAYNTRNFRGPTMQTFTVATSSEQSPSVTVSYSSNVGQWMEGVKPNPLSLFFLPGQKPKNIIIANQKFSKMTATLLDQADSIYSVNLERAETKKGGQIEIEVAPHDGIATGTYNSSFRLQVAVTDIEQPIILTIPVKIVRY
jgi:hypothetical protein